MSESGDNGLAAAIEQQATGGAPAADPFAGDPGTVEHWRAKYESEKRDRQRERNLLNRPAQVFRDLSEDQIQAITDVADAARRGDNEAIIDWSLETVQSVSGMSAADLIASRQARERGQQQPGAQAPAQIGQQTPAATPPLDAASIAQLVNQEIQRTNRLNEGHRIVAETLKGRGYEMGSTHADIILRHAVQNQIEPAAAIDWYEGELDARVQQRQAAVAQAVAGGSQVAAATPGAAPGGVAPSTAPRPDATMRENAIHRLQNNRPVS